MLPNYTYESDTDSLEKIRHPGYFPERLVIGDIIKVKGLDGKNIFKVIDSNPIKLSEILNYAT